MPSTVACEMMTASTPVDGVAAAVGDPSKAAAEAKKTAGILSAHQRTFVMAGHVVTPGGGCVGDMTRTDVRKAVTAPTPSPVALVAMTERAEPAGISYASAGVDIEAGDRAVELLKPLANKATRPEVRGGLGGFAGLFALRSYREPVLASSTDGVGTKLAVAQAMDKHDTVGIDLVAMVVDDLVVCGAEPLFLQDYIAVGRVVPERVSELVSGIANGCVMAGCALLGGETAEHPGLMAPDHYDISATGV